MITEVKFTPTETRLLKILSDGNRHHKDELFECLDDDMSSLNALAKAICLLRKKLPNGDGILVEWWRRKRFYRLVRYIGRENE